METVKVMSQQCHFLININVRMAESHSQLFQIYDYS